MTLEVKPVFIKLTKNINDFKDEYLSDKVARESSDNKGNIGDWINKLVGLATGKYEERSHQKIISHAKSFHHEQCDKPFPRKEHLKPHQIVDKKKYLINVICVTRNSNCHIN